MKIATRLLGLSLLLVLLVPELVHAGRGRRTGFSYWIGKTDSAIQVTAQTRFYLPIAPETGDAGTTEANREFPMPTTGRLTELRVYLSGDVAAAGSALAVTVRKNGADTLLTCSITGSTGTELYCENIANEVVLAKTDRVSLQFVTTGTPNAVLPAWSLRFDPDTASEVVLASVTNGNLASNVDRFWSLSQGADAVTDDSTKRLVMPFGGRIVAMFARSSGAIGAGNRTVNLVKNGNIDSTMECVLNTGAQDCKDVAEWLSFAAGDTLSAHAVSGDAATAQGVGIGLLVIPDNGGEFPLFTTATPSTAATNYLNLSAGSAGAATATEADVAAYLPGLVLLRAFMVAQTAPGAGASWAFSVRRDLSTNTGLACTIADPATSCSVANAFASEPSQRISWGSVPSAVAPASSRVMLSLAVRVR